MLDIKKFTFSDDSLMKKAHAIRYEVFVIGQNCPEDMEWEFEEESTHFLIFYNEKAVATARHRKTQKGYKLERFAVLNTERGKGFGQIVLKTILNDLSEYKDEIYMHAQTDVMQFYEKMGFKKSGAEFKEAGIMHFKMKLIN
jgi:predicted GNAT family N-acyltransferase